MNELTCDAFNGDATKCYHGNTDNSYALHLAGTRKFVTLQHAIYILQLNLVLINFHLNTLCKTLLRKEYVYIMIQLWL